MASYPENPNVPQEQRTYAAWLDRGWKAGFLLMVALFALYILGIIPPHIPLEELPNSWHLSAEKFRAMHGIHNGWWWAGQTDKSDMLNFVGITFLAGVTSVCFLRVLPIFAKNKDTVYLTIAVLELAVLLLAASGILAAGH